MKGEWATGTLTYRTKSSNGRCYFTSIFCENDVHHRRGDPFPCCNQVNNSVALPHHPVSFLDSYNELSWATCKQRCPLTYTSGGQSTWKLYHVSDEVYSLSPPFTGLRSCADFSDYSLDSCLLISSHP
ncbi:hypothetical protein EVAR_63992_1 [Eumeta japonica]|uniref:Uncharacterized protein n=1 Tax=Eumeta variegata TaxID=151549 RepID=A0A4C1Z469_EUMVA|nr:hypothetical protein EVAR_63992_1 [Eumeta japonica]